MLPSSQRVPFAVQKSGAPYNHTSTPDDLVLPSDTTEMTLADYCSNDDAGASCVFGGGENPDLELLGSQLTLSDNNLPSGSVTVERLRVADRSRAPSR
jgi:hypothetical protein